MKSVLNQDINNPLGNLDVRDDEEEDEGMSLSNEEDDVDDMEEYGDEIQIPVIPENNLGNLKAS